MDSAGTVYVTDDNRVLKLAAGVEHPDRSCRSPASAQLGGVAVDSAGNVYVVDVRRRSVKKLPAGASTQTVLPFTGVSDPQRRGGGQRRQRLCHHDSRPCIGQGDTGTNRVLKLAAGATTQTELPFTGLNEPLWCGGGLRRQRLRRRPQQQPGVETAGGVDTPRSSCRSPASTAPLVSRWTAPATSTSPTKATAGC